MSATTAFAIAAFVAAAGAAVKQNQAAQEARKSEKKNSAIQRAAEAFRNAQAARAGIARARLQAAQAQAIGEAQGVSGSSSISGATSSLFSQTAGQLGGAQVAESAAAGISRNNYVTSGKINSLNFQAGLFQTASQAFSAAAGSGFSSTNANYTGPTSSPGPYVQRSTPAFSGGGFNWNQPYQNQSIFSPRYNAR